MSIDMQPETSAAIRAELTAIGTRGSTLHRRQRRARVTASLIGVAAVAATTSAAALVIAGVPGTTTTSILGATTTVTRIGPALIDIGRAPATAGTVIVDITCLSDSGMVQVATLDGSTSSGVHCGGGGTGTLHVIDGQLPAAGTSTVSIQASPNTKWRAVLQYASAVTSEWGVNAQGQTYGVENQHGHPDLVPATADNGHKGWVLWDQTMGAEQSATVNVYESDGVTVVGHTSVEVGAPAAPLDQGYIDDLNSVTSATPTPSSH